MSTKEAVVYPEPVRKIDVFGSHLNIGRQIGEEFKDVIRHSVENAYALINSTYSTLHLTWDGAVNQGKKYLPFAQERYPQYVEEISGMAEGSGAKFYDIVALNAMEAVTMDALHLTKCTSIGVDEKHSANGHVMIAHNEDWLPEDEPDIYLVKAKPVDEPAWIGMTYGGLLPNIGMNEAGIGQCCDSVYPNDIRIGIPRIVASRAVLASRTPSEAMRHMLVPLRAAGYNHLLAHVSGEMYNVEVSAKHFSVLYADNGVIAHTNHFLDPKMQTVEAEPDALISTRIRYHRALRLLRQTEKHSEKTFQTILRDHVNYPDSICNHSQDEIDPLDREKTVNSLIMDLHERKLSIAWGSPCKNRYNTYSL